MNSHHLIKTLAMAALLMPLQSMSAQTDSSKINKLSIGLNFLTHGEVRGGGLPKAETESATMENSANFLLGRTRLTVAYQRQRVTDEASGLKIGLEARAVIQNNAIWGMKNNQSINLYEGWVKANTSVGIFAQVGRIALAYDDERIIGPNDFATAAKSHDLLRLGYEGHNHKLHALLAYNQNSSNVFGGSYYADGAQYYKTMQTLWYHYDVPRFPLGASLLFMNIGEQAGFTEDDRRSQSDPAHTEYQQMMGGYVNFHPEHLTLEGSYYRQAGKEVNEDMLSSKIKSWMASVKATIKPSDKYGFVLGYDYLSGDDYMVVREPGSMGLIQHEVLEGFRPVYGSRTKFYGIMDYFYRSVHLDGFTPGLQNTFGGMFGNPLRNLDCEVVYHYMATATNLRSLDKTLGHAIELKASYRFTKDINLTAGFTQMIGTDTMDRLKQGNGDQHVSWGWFSLVINPNLFTSKW